MPHTSIEWEIPCVVEIDFTPASKGSTNPDSPWFGPDEPFSWEITAVMVGDVDVLEKLTKPQQEQLAREIDTLRLETNEAYDPRF